MKREESRLVKGVCAITSSSFFSYPLWRNCVIKTANMEEMLVGLRLGQRQRERTSVGERMDDIDVVGAHA